MVCTGRLCIARGVGVCHLICVCVCLFMYALLFVSFVRARTCRNYCLRCRVWYVCLKRSLRVDERACGAILAALSDNLC